jgi:acyl dehydratase
MGMSKSTIGKKYQPFEGKVDGHEAMYFALATNNYNEWYINQEREGGVVAPPMYIIAKELGGPAVGQALFDQEIGANMAMLVHGEQTNEWFAPLTHGRQVKFQTYVEDIQEKGTGELLVVGVDGTDPKTGEKIAKLKFGFFVRAQGGGKKGPKEPAPPEDRSKKAFEQKMVVMRGQTYVYAEAGGDHNTIHKDPKFAKMVGLPGIILQGLCTMSFVQKAVIDGACGGDPNKLKKLFVRFKKPVLPGDTITSLGWIISEEGGTKTLGIETKNQNGEVVIVDSRAIVAA